MDDQIHIGNSDIWEPPPMHILPSPVEVVYPTYQPISQPLQPPNLLATHHPPIVIPTSHIIHSAATELRFSFESSSLSAALAEPPSRISYARTSSSELSNQIPEPSPVIQPSLLPTHPSQDIVYDEPLPEHDYPIEPGADPHEYYEEPGPRSSSRGTSVSPQSPAFPEIAEHQNDTPVVDVSIHATDAPDVSHSEPALPEPIVPNISGELHTLVPISRPRKRKADKAHFSTSPIARIIPPFNGVVQDPPRLSSKLAVSSE